MQDPFASRVAALNDPARDIVPIMPSDTVDLDRVAVAIYVEQGGALSFVSEAGAVRTVTVGNLSILPVGVRRVNATGTTAGGLHGLMV